MNDSIYHNTFKFEPADNVFDNLRILLREALQAGKYIASDDDWQPFHTGEILQFQEKATGTEQSGSLVLVKKISEEIVEASVTGDEHCFIIIGETLKAAVDLGKKRIKRFERVADFATHYWATFILEDSGLVTLGTPTSTCRLIGEVMNLQMPTPFVQRRICASCHALNDYYNAKCSKCGRPLRATGRLGQQE